MILTLWISLSLHYCLSLPTFSWPPMHRSVRLLLSFGLLLLSLILLFFSPSPALLNVGVSLGPIVCPSFFLLSKFSLHSRNLTHMLMVRCLHLSFNQVQPLVLQGEHSMGFRPSSCPSLVNIVQLP